MFSGSLYGETCTTISTHFSSTQNTIQNSTPALTTDGRMLPATQIKLILTYYYLLLNSFELESLMTALQDTGPVCYRLVSNQIFTLRLFPAPRGAIFTRPLVRCRWGQRNRPEVRICMGILQVNEKVSHFHIYLLIGIARLKVSLCSCLNKNMHGHFQPLKSSAITGTSVHNYVTVCCVQFSCLDFRERRQLNK